MGPFRDRTDAGRYLARQLMAHVPEHPVVLALPRGGLPVAAEIAEQLGAELDVVAVKKIGAPDHPEVALGAVAEGGELVLDEQVARLLDPTHKYAEAVAERKRAELAGSLARFRRIRPRLPVAGRTVIVVDDGLATGTTMKAAVRVVRARGAKRVIVAVPVAAPEACEKLASEADEIVALVVPVEFYAVGVWYEDFSQVSEIEAAQILGRSLPGVA